MGLEEAIIALAHRLEGQSQQQVIANKLMIGYIRNQIEGSQSSPAEAIPGVFNLLNPLVGNSVAALQVIPKRDNRYKVAIMNLGPSNIIYARKYFDPGSVLQNFSDPSNPDGVLPGYNQYVEIGFLPAGSNVTLNGKDGIWAYATGSLAQVNQNALISIQDSLYRSARTYTIGVNEWKNENVGAEVVSSNGNGTAADTVFK